MASWGGYCDRSGRGEGRTWTRPASGPGKRGVWSGFGVEIFEGVPEIVAGGGGGVLAGFPAGLAVVVALGVLDALGLRHVGAADAAELALRVGDRHADDGAAL